MLGFENSWVSICLIFSNILFGKIQFIPIGLVS